MGFIRSRKIINQALEINNLYRKALARESKRFSSIDNLIIPGTTGGAYIELNLADTWSQNISVNINLDSYSDLNTNEYYNELFTTYETHFVEVKSFDTEVRELIDLYEAYRCTDILLDIKRLINERNEAIRKALLKVKKGGKSLFLKAKKLIRTFWHSFYQNSIRSHFKIISSGSIDEDNSIAVPGFIVSRLSNLTINLLNHEKTYKRISY